VLGPDRDVGAEVAAQIADRVHDADAGCGGGAGQKRGGQRPEKLDVESRLQAADPEGEGGIR